MTNNMQKETLSVTGEDIWLKLPLLLMTGACFQVLRG